MRLPDWPKVSVIISTYNRPVMLKRALESVLAQDYDDFDVIVVDDCSPDQDAINEVGREMYDRFAARFVDRKSVV